MIRAVAVALLLLSCTPRVAFGQSAPMWNEEWPKFHAWEYGAMGVMVGGIAVFSSADPQPKERWTGTLPGDTWARDGLRAKTRKGRTAAARVSDLFLYTLVSYPLVDAGVVSTMDGTNGAGGQMALISAQSFALTSITQRVVSTASGRVRPYALGCAEDPDYRERCDRPDRNRSFFSGHTSLAFTGAGLTCAQHLRLKPYGGAADGIACGTALALATATGTLRIVSDRHYLSDVVVGAAWGMASGLLLPMALHYGFRAPSGEVGTERRRRPAVLRVTIAF